MSKESGFELHAQLAADCLVVGDLPLNRVLLMNDAHYPWCILVPRRAGLVELYDLDEADGAQFLAESRLLASGMMAAFNGEKFNVGALGNVVPQLHIHHIVRRKDDAAWPRPIWGVMPTVPYASAVLEERLAILRNIISSN